MGGYQDHRRPAAAVVFGQAPGNVEPALIAQSDVDQDDIRAELRCSLQRLRRGRGHADDAQALAFQEIPSSLEKQPVVIHNQDTERHTNRIPVGTAPCIAASRNPKIRAFAAEPAQRKMADIEVAVSDAMVELTRLNEFEADR